MVLEEVFLLNIFEEDFWSHCQTVSDLSRLSSMDVGEVIRRLRDLVALNEGIHYDPKSPFVFKEKGHIFLDVRPPSPDLTLRRPKNVLALDQQRMDRLWQDIRLKNQTLVTICPDGKRSYSAAMYFRSLGHHNTYFFVHHLQSPVD